MHILQLTLGPAGWRLEWDDKLFVLRKPNGKPVIESDLTRAHRLIDAHGLYSVCSIGIGLSVKNGWLIFKKNKAARNQLRLLLEAGLRNDSEYRGQLLLLGLGLVLYGIDGIIFARKLRRLVDRAAER